MEENMKMENQVQTKQNSKKKFLVIGIILIAVVIFSTFMIFGPVEYIRNKNFHNGIKGTYVCTDVIVPYTNKVVSKADVEAIFLGMECEVSSNGSVSGIFKGNEFKLIYNGNFFNFPLGCSVPYYASHTGQSVDLYATNVDYAKASRDKSIEKNHLSFQFVYKGENFFVNFEQVED